MNTHNENTGAQRTAGSQPGWPTEEISGPAKPGGHQTGQQEQCRRQSPVPRIFLDLQYARWKNCNGLPLSMTRDRRADKADGRCCRKNHAIPDTGNGNRPAGSKLWSAIRPVFASPRSESRAGGGTVAVSDFRARPVPAVMPVQCGRRNIRGRQRDQSHRHRLHRPAPEQTERG